jgi:hypothetical protein
VAYPGLPDRDGTRVPVGEYTLRSTGASFSVGRRVLPNTDLIVAARGTFDGYIAGAGSEPCEFDADGNVVNRGSLCAAAGAGGDLPPAGGPQRLHVGHAELRRPRQRRVPARGLAASVLVGVGWGNDQRDPDTVPQQPYSYQQVQAGVKTYVTLADLSRR